ncbi:MAG: MFS transporter [Motilibacteraceae bacterium]
MTASTRTASTSTNHPSTLSSDRRSESSAAGHHLERPPEGGRPKVGLPWRLRLILAVVLVADVVDLMDSTVTTVAAPTIARELGGGQALVSWLGASYALALGVLLVTGGRLGDRYGRRRLFLIGIAGFGIASLLCGLSVDPAMLVGARLAQGAFGALLIPQGFGLLLASFSREQFTVAATAFGPVLGGAAILGPVVAGFVISADLGGLTWRPLFLINIVLCLTGFFAGRRLLPPDTTLQRDPIDAVGSTLLALAMLALVGGLVDGSSNGWDLRPAIALLTGAALLGLFGVRQVTCASPLLRPSLLGNRGFTSGLLLGLAYFAAANGLCYALSLYFQLSLGLSAAKASLGLAPLMVGIMAASFVARPLIPRLGRTLVVAGLGLTLAGAVGLLLTTALAGSGTTTLDAAPAVLALGAGMGVCFSSIYDVAIGDVRPDEAGGASGALSAVQQLAAAIGTASVTAVYFGQLPHGGVHALRAGVIVIAAVTLLCLALVRLLPRTAPAEQH